MTSPDWQTQRRLQVLALHDKGGRQKPIAETLYLSKGAVSPWLKKTRGLSEAEQSAALQGRKRAGRPPLLSSPQRRQIASVVQTSAEAFGFVGWFWSLKRVRAVARRPFGLVVSVSTVVRCLKAQGYSPQKPQRVARERQERQEKAFDGAGIVGFLAHLLCQITGKGIVLWDGARIHRGKNDTTCDYSSCRSDALTTAASTGYE